MGSYCAIGSVKGQILPMPTLILGAWTHIVCIENA